MRIVPTGLSQGCLALLVCVAGLFLFPAAASATGRAMEILVPAYFYPVAGSPWDDLIQAAPQHPIVAIANPANGPGLSIDPAYTAVIDDLRAAGGKVIGYVHTTYTDRSLSEVQADVDDFLAFYNLDGVFIDEMTNDSTSPHLDYYAALYAYIKSQGPALLVVGNPGTQTEEAYLLRPCADRLVTFEHHTGYPGYVPDTWVNNWPADRFVHLMYDVGSAATMQSFVNLAAQRNAGAVYVTDDQGANPWDTLPAYWSTELAVVDTTYVPCPAAVGDPPRAGETRDLLSARPNPSSSVVNFKSIGVEAGSARLQIFDVRGRLVRLMDGTTGDNHLWDGRDQGGSRVLPGIYLARLEGARKGRSSVKVVIVR
jgi:hypothetical protein